MIAISSSELSPGFVHVIDASASVASIIKKRVGFEVAMSGEILYERTSRDSLLTSRKDLERDRISGSSAF